MKPYSLYITFFLIVSASHLIAQHTDCQTALMVCDSSSLYIVPGGGEGLIDEDVVNSCVLEEYNSMWVKWTVLESGIITFELTPDSIGQDLDFIVYQSESDDDCIHKTQIRCMAAGANIGAPPHSWANCTGPTGLAIGEIDIEAQAGCPDSSSNNFLAPIEALAGDHYIMLINEFTGGGYGYTLSFAGTALLDCITVSVDTEEKRSNEFTVYPTFSTGTIYISHTLSGQTETRLNVFNTSGQMVYSNEQLIGISSQVDLHHLPQGIYYAVVQTCNSTQTERFIITN